MKSGEGGFLRDTYSHKVGRDDVCVIDAGCERDDGTECVRPITYTQLIGKANK